jgi:hypothetical protein
LRHVSWSDCHSQEAKGPDAAAGLLANDVLGVFNGELVRGMHHLKELLFDYCPFEPLKVPFLSF